MPFVREVVFRKLGTEPKDLGEAATTIPNPEPRTLNPEPFLHSFFEIHGKILYNKTLEYNQAQRTNFCEAKKEGYHVSH